MVEKSNFKKLIRPTRCAICDTLNNSTLLYKEKIPDVGIDGTVYTPRRDRDYYHYRLVRCKTCSLVRSDPILDSKQQEKLYKESLCLYSETSENYLLKKTYGNYIRKLIKDYKIKKNSYLDIGCANGFLLEKAIELGFENVKGIEPSDDAIKKANSKIKPHIMKGLFTSKLFDENRFDLITFFQTFDHIPDPNTFLKDCFHVLKKGGFVLAINHNVEAMSAKLLRENSPIFDIGHAYLYDLKTMRKDS